MPFAATITTEDLTLSATSNDEGLLYTVITSDSHSGTSYIWPTPLSPADISALITCMLTGDDEGPIYDNCAALVPASCPARCRPIP